MRHLWILRHGKAASDGPDVDDHSRPLTGRGRRQSAEAGAFVTRLLETGTPPPDVVLTSSAARARQTAEAVHAVLGDDVMLDIRRSLYDAAPDDVVTLLRGLPDETTGVMIVGHNPTFHDLALLLLAPDDTEGRARLEAGFPTAAMALLAFDVPSWTAVGEGTGRLEELFVPAK